MAHFCELDENNIVINVTVIDNKDIVDENNNEIEQKGIDLCKKIFNKPNGIFVQTSINSLGGKRIDASGKPVFRHTCGQIGDRWDPVKQVFIAKSPFPSWKLNEITNNWEPPIKEPTEEQCYYGQDPFIPFSDLSKVLPTGEALDKATNYIYVLSPYTNQMAKILPGRLGVVWDEEKLKFRGLHQDGQLRYWDGFNWDKPL